MRVYGPKRHIWNFAFPLAIHRNGCCLQSPHSGMSGILQVMFLFWVFEFGEWYFPVPQADVPSGTYHLSNEPAVEKGKGLSA